MKIVQAVGWYFPETVGGTEVYVAALASRFSRCGHEVMVAAPDASAREERTYEYDGVRVFRYPIPTRPTRAEAHGRVPTRGAERVRRFLADVRPDIVHMHTFVTGLGLHEAHAAKDVGARLIATTHAGSLGFICQRGTMMRWGTELCDGVAGPAKCAACVLQHRGMTAAFARGFARIPPTMSRHLRTIPGRIGTTLTMTDTIAWAQQEQRDLLDTVDRFVVLTDWARRAVIANGATPAKVVLNRLGIAAMPASRQHASARRSNTGPLRIGCVSRFDPDKGLSDLVDALRRIPSTRLFAAEIRGAARSATERAFAVDLARQAASDPRITVAGEVAAANVFETLAGYDVMCCPSRTLEGGPTIALEARAVGTPVIGSAIGGLAELIDDGVDGELVAPGDVNGLADALEMVIAHPETIDRWRARLAPPRTMDDVAREYLDLYRN